MQLSVVEKTVCYFKREDVSNIVEVVLKLTF